MSKAMTSEALPCQRVRRTRLKSTAALILGPNQKGYVAGDDHDLQQWREDADQSAATGRTVLAWTSAFERVCKMEGPLTAISELSEALLLLDLQDASESRVVHRLVTAIKEQCDAAQNLRSDLFELAHKESDASAALDREIEQWKQAEGRD